MNFGLIWCASGCVVKCRICNREVTGSNLGWGYFAQTSTQPSIPPWLVNEYQLWLRRQRQVWLIPLADETQGVQVKMGYPFTMQMLTRCNKTTTLQTRLTADVKACAVSALLASSTHLCQHKQTDTHTQAQRSSVSTNTFSVKSQQAHCHFIGACNEH